MLLSIIIPAYNAERYLGTCLDSILNGLDEELKEIEIIVIDDASSDNTKEVMLRYKDKIRGFYNENNKGVSFSRNIGIANAAGKFIMFVDSDDMLNNGWLNIIKEGLNYEKDLTIFSSGLNESNNDKQSILFSILGISEKKNFFSSPWSKIYRRSIFDEYNIKFNNEIFHGEDMLMNLEFLSKAKTVKKVKKSFYSYRLTVGSITRSFNEKIYNSDKNFHSELKMILENFQMDGKTKESILQECIRNALIMIMRKISYEKKYWNAKQYYKLIDNKFYKFKLCEEKSFFKFLILLLYKLKLFFFIHLIIRFINKIKANDKVQTINI